MTTSRQIDKWREVPTEVCSLEFKEAKNSFSLVKLYEYCVAIANEGGGHLVLGVADKPPRPVVGTKALANTSKTMKQVFDKIGFRVEIKEVQHPDGRVVVVSVPPRPQGTPRGLDGRFLMRVGESLQSMSADQLRNIYDEGKPDWLEETAREGMSGQEVVDSLDIQAYFELMNEPFPTSTSVVLDRLVERKLIDRANGIYSIRRLGALLLARRLSDYDDVAPKAPRVVVYNGISKMETKLDWFSEKGYAVGFEAIAQFVMAQLPQNEIMESAIRREVTLVPDITIRELVANALVHQDFTLSGSTVRIEIYDNRVEISNPGLPIVEIERFLDGDQSRNERLANLMRRMGICEVKGSGIDKVVKAVEDYQLPAPDFQKGSNRTIAILFGHKPFKDMNREERIRACYQHAALKQVVRESMTNQSLRNRFNLPKTSVNSTIVAQILTATAEAGLIKRDLSVGTSRRLSRYLPFWA